MTNKKGMKGCCTPRYSHNPDRSGIDMQDRRLQLLPNCVHELVLCIEPLLESLIAKADTS